MAKAHELWAKGKVVGFLYGRDHQKFKDIKTIWDFTTTIASTLDKRPEDSMLMHTSQVILRNRGFKINSDPKIKERKNNAIN